MFEAGKSYSMCVDCIREHGELDAATSDTAYLTANGAIYPNYDGKVRCNRHLRVNLSGIKSELLKQIAEIEKFEEKIKD